MTSLRQHSWRVSQRRLSGTCKSARVCGPAAGLQGSGAGVRCEAEVGETPDTTASVPMREQPCRPAPLLGWTKLERLVRGSLDACFVLAKRSPHQRDSSLLTFFQAARAASSGDAFPASQCTSAV